MSSDEALPIEAGKEYAFELRIRSDARRPLQYALSQAHAPWENLGLSGGLTLTPDWQTVRRKIVAARDDASARLVLALGGSKEPVEIGAVRLLRGEIEMLPPEPGDSTVR